MDGDGLADVIVGACRADLAGQNDAGESYVTFSPVVRGDLDGDRSVGIVDFLLLLYSAWGPCPAACPLFCPGDLDACTVGIVDFLLLWPIAADRWRMARQTSK